MNTNGKILVGFLLGTAIGTITGLLMAPATGNRTRKSLTKKSKKIIKQLSGLINKNKKEKKASSAHVRSKNGRPALEAS